MWKILDKKFKIFYALKEISKVKVIDKKSINSIMYERELLSRINHPLIINLQYAFQDYNNLYLVLDLLTGGDLRYQIGHHRRQYFSEQQTKFFVSCIISALYYIHNNNIIHRDIKPENLVFDDKGYLHITDFGIAKFKNKNNKNETSGTPGYMAPEVMKGMNHTGSVDYFAVGVITYELMIGKRPYVGKSRKEIKEQMMSKQIYLDTVMIPNDWSEEAADFINKLLVRKDVKRLGFYNELEIQNHPWFSDINFDKIVKKELISPFIPRINHDNYDKKYCEEIEKIGFETNYRYEEYKANEHYRNIFAGFTFYNVDESRYKIYRKPSIKYIQNKKYKITESLKEKKYQTINIDKPKNDLSFNKKSTIDYDYFFNNNDTIDVDDYFNILNVKKNINEINKDDKGNNLQNYTGNKHKRIKSNLVGHNFLFFLQKKKLFYSNENDKQNIDNISVSNNNENSLYNTMKIKKNNTLSYHKIKNKEEKKMHNGLASNNIYLKLLNKIRKEKSGIDNLLEIKSLDEKECLDKKNKKKTIELTKAPKMIKIDNNNYRNLKYLTKKIKEPLSIENNDSIPNNSKIQNKELTEKISMMKAATNFYMKHQIPHTKLNRLITPNNLKNEKMLFNSNNIKNKKYVPLNNDKTIENSSRRFHHKIRTKSFSKNSYLDNSNQYQSILNIISSEEQSLDNKHINKKGSLNNIVYNKINKPQIKYNNSYSSFNNKKKIEYMINNIFEPDKNKKTQIPMTFKKSSNTLVNTSKISNLHKKIPIPLTFGKRINSKGINEYFDKKISIPINSNFSTTNNNSINSSSVSKHFIFNKNNSSNKTTKKVKTNIIIKSYLNNNSTINLNKKKYNKLSINSNNTNNYSSLFKKMSDFSIEHKKNYTIGNNIIFPTSKKNIFQKNSKITKLEKFSIKNKLLKGKIKKVGNANIRKKFNENLMNLKKKNENNFNEEYNRINNIILNKKISNCNSKNKINSNNKSLKSSNIASFSYHSYNSTTSSGCKINNK